MKKSDGLTLTWDCSPVKRSDGSTLSWDCSLMKERCFLADPGLNRNQSISHNIIFILRH